MNSLNHHLDTAARVVIAPETVTQTHKCRHPIFFWNVRHIRSITIKPVVRINTYRAHYSDPTHNVTFQDRQSAEIYLGCKIAEPEYVGQSCVTRVREAYMYAICTGCGHVGCEKSEVQFTGPFNVIQEGIDKTVELPCTKCGQSTRCEISTEPCSKEVPSDCAWH